MSGDRFEDILLCFGEGRAIPRYVPYLVLVIISIILWVLLWRKEKSGKIIPFYLTISGLIYLFEFVVLVVFKGYMYTPGVFKNAFIDDMLGATVSNGFIVPAVCVCIAVFDIGFWWICLITLGLMGAEELFLYLGVYRHFWWLTIYTGIGLLVVFHIGKWLWYAIRRRADQFFLQFIVFYFDSIALQATTAFIFTAVFRIYHFQVHWFSDATRGHVALSTVVIVMDSIFFSLATVLRAGWAWNGLLLAAVLAFSLMMKRFGILLVPGYWAVGIWVFSKAAVLAMLAYCRRLLHRTNT